VVSPFLLLLTALGVSFLPRLLVPFPFRFESRCWVFVASVLDSEIINKQTEENGTGSMGEETRSMLYLDVTVLGEMLDESVVGQLAGLGKTAHVFADPI
jgi:hypothetical protein